MSLSFYDIVDVKRGGYLNVVTIVGPWGSGYHYCTTSFN